MAEPIFLLNRSEDGGSLPHLPVMKNDEVHAQLTSHVTNYFMPSVPQTSSLGNLACVCSQQQ